MLKKKKKKIKKIETYVGGYFGGYHQVEVDLENNSVTWTHGGEGKLEESIYRNIRSATAKKLLEQLELLNLLNWEAEYVDPGTLDGTQWHVEIVMDGHTVTTWIPGTPNYKKTKNNHKALI